MFPAGSPGLDTRRKGKEMARTNRIVVEDGLYHVTARVAHGARLLADRGLKSLIVEWMYGIADFAGIEVAAWSVMDNHIHLLLHVPPVPERYWTESGTCPLATWRSMRPAECRAQRWMPDGGDSPSSRGDSPLRPPVGFSMSDEEMIGRLKGLYRGWSEAVAKTSRRWAQMRGRGLGQDVEDEKARLCRRMYSVSQYMHAFKQHISEHFNRRLGHSGQLWQGRFHSTLVEKEDLSKLFVSAYIEWNAPKAGVARHPKDWKWCSYAAACGSGELADRARKGFESLFFVSWEEVKARLDAVFADRLPHGWKKDADADDGRRVRLRMSQLLKVLSLSHCAFFSRRRGFVLETLALLPMCFPASGGRFVEYLSAFDWDEPPRVVA